VSGVLLANLDANMLWYAVPLMIAVSLVYAATRHEHLVPILRHAVHVGIWIAGFMLTVLAVFFVLWLISLRF
jgi:hypothetical protein